MNRDSPLVPKYFITDMLTMYCTKIGVFHVTILNIYASQWVGGGVSELN